MRRRSVLFQLFCLLFAVILPLNGCLAEEPAADWISSSIEETEEYSPEETSLPTEEPEATEEPAATEEPVPTEIPTATEEPVPTEEPVQTEEPAETETPAATEEPAATETPAPLEETREAQIVRDTQAYFDLDCAQPAFLLEAGQRCMLIDAGEALCEIELPAGSSTVRVFVAAGDVEKIPESEQPAETPNPSPEPTIAAGDVSAPECVDGVYQIATGDELRWFAALANASDGNVSAVLTGDIDLADFAWMPIGSAERPYSGRFDGAGHSISGLNICSEQSYQALFGFLSKEADVRDFSLYGRVECGGDYAAGAAAYSEASLNAIHNYCEIVSAGKCAGGVAGEVAEGARLNGCTNAGSVSSTGAAGRVGGVAGSGSAVDCKNGGAVSGYAYVGGVAGNAGYVENCANTGDVSGAHQYIGGVAGNASSIQNCTNAGAVRLRGVFVSLRDRYEGGYVGGVAGAAGKASGCENRGRVESAADGDIFISSAAGVAGKCANSTANCENRGDVRVDGSYIAGVVGGNGGGSVVQCVNYGSVQNQANGGEQTGGVASAGQIESSCNYGSVRGYQSVGGVCGGTSGSTVRNCYNLGAVSGSNRTGGVAGVCLSAEWCYSAGSVSCRGNAAGMLAGSVSRAENCFYLNESAGVYSRAGEALDADALRLCMRDAEAYRINFDRKCQSGYALLNFQTAGEAVPADSVRLLPGAAREYSARLGGELRGLPGQVEIAAGGLEIRCAAEWACADGFDINQPGEYVFRPQIAIRGCYIGDSTAVDEIVVRVCAEEELPEISAWRLDESAALKYTTDYGCAPTGFPDGAWATVDGAEQYISIEWIAPENLDLTDAETEFLYTARPIGAFRMGADAGELTVSLRVLPMQLIAGLRFTDRNNRDAAEYALHYQGCESGADGLVFRYTLDIFDQTSALYLWADWNADYDAGVKYRYQKLDASSSERTGSLKSGKSLNLSGFATRNSAYARENTLILTASAEKDGAQILQRYEITTRLFPTLDALRIVSGATEAYLLPEFDAQWFDYSAQVPISATEAEIAVQTALDNVRVSIGDQELAKGEDGIYRHIANLESDAAEIELVLTRAAGEESVESRYLLHLRHQQETILEARCAPEGAVFYIANDITGRVFADADGLYRLIRGYDYHYTATAEDYVAQAGELIADQERMALEIALVPAEKNGDIVPDTDSDWSDFRGSEDNNGVTSVPMPVSASDAVLYWANQAGISFSSDAVSSPILVGGYLVCTAKQNIFKIDTVTGEIVQVGDMVRKSAFNITPPTYAAGMIFVALADGYIQAFNAQTLQSLWVYQDALGGQPNSPITYRNGHIYTGFWNGESKNGNWVCLSVTDEDPSRETEAKYATWTYSQKGGFYWAGACVRDRFLLVGTDDGEIGYTSQNSNLLSLEPGSGRLIDCLSGLDADVRCSICYDAKTNRYYFTSKGGCFYSVAVSESGYFDRDSLKKLDLRGGRTSEGKPVEGMSTSTPVVYNGRAYVGVSGVGQFSAYSGHCIAVIDLASWSIAYTCPTKGYPQTSGLLTNAYENTGLVYIYFFENMSPGSLRVIRDCPGQTEMLSIYDGSPIDTAEAIFTPRGAQRQYALCSPIVDAYGTIYFKNDSGYMMALGSMISGLEIADTPRKLLYEEGETFESDGMRVIARMSNGLARDVSAYVSVTDQPLQPGDTDVTVYFRHVRYNNDAEIVDPPQTSVNITVLSHEEMAQLRDTVNAIDALGEISIESGAAIREARRKYDALSVRLQELVHNYALLTGAEEEYERIERAENEKIDRVRRLIAAIGEVTLDSGDTLREAFEVYCSLSDSGRAQLAAEYAILRQKQADYERLIAAQDEAAAAVMRLISDLGEIGIDSGAKLAKARDAYDALSETSRAKVTNLSALEAAEARYRALIDASGEAARRVIDLIEAIGEVTLDKEKAIQRAREAYDALDADSAQRVTNLDRLLAAEKRLSELKAQRGELGEILAQLDALCAEIRAAAPEAENVNAENIALLARPVQGIYDLLNAQDDEKRALLSDYARIADSYRAAIAQVNHSNDALGVSVEGLNWSWQLQASIASGEDYDRFAAEVAPLRVLKLYRMRIVDLLTGEEVDRHDSLPLQWTIPVPRYNESAYSAIGAAHGASSGAIRNPESALKGSRQLSFATTGDGLIGVVGTKAEMRRDDGKKGSGSVLDELNRGQSGEAQPGETTRSYSRVQSDAVSYYGETVASGQWAYRENVIAPALLAALSDAQVEAYRALSEAVEKGENSCFNHLISEEEFAEVEARYRWCNPLAALVQELDNQIDAGKIEIQYALAEEEHLRAIDEWHAQIERIVHYCLIQGDAEITAARLYQYLTATLQTEIPEASEPSAYSALMWNWARGSDAAQAYAYLLMQVGMECMPVREAAGEDAAETREWLILKIGDAYYHAVPQLDLANPADPDAERDTLGHFGMSDAECRAALALERPVEMAVPDCMRPAEETDELFAVPKCPAGLEGYGMRQTVIEMEKAG